MLSMFREIFLKYLALVPWECFENSTAPFTHKRRVSKEQKPTQNKIQRKKQKQSPPITHVPEAAGDMLWKLSVDKAP